ncbi:hypothetical protein D3C81_1828640 [compost metagenome]
MCPNPQSTKVVMDCEQGYENFFNRDCCYISVNGAGRGTKLLFSRIEVDRSDNKIYCRYIKSMIGK